jgi:hypothetical protein
VVLEKNGEDKLDRSCDVLRRVKEERNILHTIKTRKANWTGKLEGGIEVTGRQGRKRKQLVEDLKGTIVYGNMEGKTLYRTEWRTRFGRGCGPVVRQTAE